MTASMVDRKDSMTLIAISWKTTYNLRIEQNTRGSQIDAVATKKDQLQRNSLQLSKCSIILARINLQAHFRAGAGGCYLNCTLVRLASNHSA